VEFTEIVDERRSPELMGVVDQRAVRAPPDATAWMREILSALGTRGLSVHLDAAPPDPRSPPITAKFRLQTAWLASTGATYNANAVMTLEAHTPEGRTFTQTYRGRTVHTTYWSAGTDTLQGAMTSAFAKALDAMSTDLRALC
jgi:hypothetical protein